MVSDPIADFLTRLRNGLMAKKREVLTNCSNMSKKMAEILVNRGYIDSFEVESEGPKKNLRVKLRYDSANRPIADGLKRISKPGLRVYAKASEIPIVRGGMGIAIVSTSRGVMTGVEAQKNNIGGEVLCIIW